MVTPFVFSPARRAGLHQFSERLARLTSSRKPHSERSGGGFRVAEQVFFSASRLTLGGSEGRLRGIHRPKQRAQGGRAETNQN
jgi:hypothetical protein